MAVPMRMAVHMVHTHHRETVGESRFDSLWSGTQARRWWAVPMSHGWSRVRVRQAVRGCVLEGDADAAARGVFDGLFGLKHGLEHILGRQQGLSKRERGHSAPLSS